MPNKFEVPAVCSEWSAFFPLSALVFDINYISLSFAHHFDHTSDQAMNVNKRSKNNNNNNNNTLRLFDANPFQMHMYIRRPSSSSSSPFAQTQQQLFPDDQLNTRQKGGKCAEFDININKMNSEREREEERKREKIACTLHLMVTWVLFQMK